ncbi:MAG: HAD family hydrolase [Minisyncoccota bacterium]
MSELKKVAKRLWVFDLDGPLMNTGELYEVALVSSTDLIYEVCNGRFSKEEIRFAQNEIDKKMLREIDPKNGQPFLYRKSRFPLSLIRTYKYFCQKLGKEFKRNLAHQLNKIGKKVFDEHCYEKTIRPQVLPLFKFLKEEGDKVFILTKGAEEVQLGKKKALQNLGIMDHCDGFIVVPDTKDEAIKRIREDNFALRYYCVGDTYLEDVLPGMNVGYFGIYIPYEFNWKERDRFEEIESCRDKERSVRYLHVGQISQYFCKLKSI